MDLELPGKSFVEELDATRSLLTQKLHENSCSENCYLIVCSRSLSPQQKMSSSFCRGREGGEPPHDVFILDDK